PPSPGLTLLSRRNMTRAEERLERIGRPKSLVDIELAQQKSQERFSGLKETIVPSAAAASPSRVNASTATGHAATRPCDPTSRFFGEPNTRLLAPSRAHSRMM